jgi:hypothetical protein
MNRENLVWRGTISSQRAEILPITITILRSLPICDNDSFLGRDYPGLYGGLLPPHGYREYGAYSRHHDGKQEDRRISQPANDNAGNRA